MMLPLTVASRRFLIGSCLFLSMGYSSAVALRTPAPMPIPLDQMLAKAEALVAKNPADAHGYYILGEVHHLAFLRGCATLYYSPLSSGPPVDPIGFEGNIDSEAMRRAGKVLGITGQTVWAGTALARRYSALIERYREKLEREEWMSKRDLSWKVRLEHAEKADGNLREAMRLAPTASEYPLALATFADDYDRTISRWPKMKPQPAMERLSAQEIRRLYWLAVTLSAPPGNNWKAFADRVVKSQKLEEFGPYDGMNWRVYPLALDRFIVAATRPSARLSKEEQEFLEIARSGKVHWHEFADVYFDR